MPDRVHSISSLVCVVTALQQSSVCIGNPDSVFKPLVEARKGLFKNNQGMFAYVQTSWISWYQFSKGLKLWQQLRLHLPAVWPYDTMNVTLWYQVEGGVLSAKSTGNCCLSWLTDLKVYATDPQSHVNYRYLSSPQLAERCENLHNSLIASQKCVSLLRNKIEKLCESQAVLVSSELDDDLWHRRKILPR